ncbi:hypothetical protein ABPG74_008107 [Tetrahymena malaccensis]
MKIYIYDPDLNNTYYMTQNIFLVLADAGTTSVSCFLDSVCTDVSCGRAGGSNNWKSTGTDGNCLVADCSQLTLGKQVADRACASCYTNQTPATIYANNAGTYCVTSNCLQLTFNRKMTTSDCQICVGEGSQVNPDNSTCTASTLTTQSSKLNYYNHLLLAIFVLIIFKV